MAIIEVETEAEAWLSDLPDAEARVRQAAEAALATAGPEALSDLRAEPEITVLLSDDDEIAALNAQFRAKATSTNVLAFPAPAFARPHLGDVILAHGVCAAEAKAQGKPLGDHLAHLVAHGVLHLLGWDHQTDAEAAEMEDLERTALAGLGISDPYAARDGTDERGRTD